MPLGASRDPDGRSSAGGKATSPGAVPCKLGTSPLAGGQLPTLIPPAFGKCFSPRNRPREPPRAGRGLLARAPAVAVTLLLVGPVRGVPLEQVGVVGQHHLDGLQRLGAGSFLQGAPLLWERAKGRGWGVSTASPGGRIPHRRAEDGRHTEPVTPGSPTHPHGQGKYAAAAEPRRPQRALATARHRDVALLVITCREGLASARPGWPEPPSPRRHARTHPARTSRR